VNGFGRKFGAICPETEKSMFLLRLSDLHQPVNVGPPTAYAGLMVCPAVLWPTAPQAQSWAAIYQLAYDQIATTIAPSLFQRMREPSLN
jgi:hypothetical protein